MTLTEKQQKIIQLLKNLDPKISSTYEGGILVLEQQYSEKIFQSANSIRETVYMMTRLDEIKKLGRIKTPHKKSSSRKNDLIEHLDPVKTAPNEAYVLYDKLANHMLDWFTAVAHHGKLVTENKYKNKLNEFEDLIEKILEPHFNVIAKIDKLKDQPSTKKNYDKIKFLISRNSSAHNYFLQNASGEWIKFLIKEKYFRNPPKIVREGEMIRFFPSWVSYYIQKVADQKPKETSQFIRNYTVSKKPEERNPWVLENFVKAITKMPIKYSKHIATKIFEEKWLKMPYYNVLVYNAISKLMIKFVEAGQKKESLMLTRALLDVDLGIPYATGGILEKYQLRRNVIAITDSYFYEKLLKNEIPLLFDKFPIETITVLIEILRKMIYLENVGIGHPRTNEDISDIWRPSIDDHEQNSDRDFRSNLVGVIGKVITHKKLSIPLIKKIAKILTNEKYPIFRRLELHLYQKFPEQFKKEINESVIQCFSNNHLHHEYFHLLNTSFSNLTDKTKESYFNLIEKGASKELLELWTEKAKHQQSGYVELRLRNWQMGKLEPVMEFLNKEEKERFCITDETPSPHSDFRAYRSGPKKSEPVTEMQEELTKDEVFEFIKSYKPKERDFGYYDGTFEKFQEYVKKNPVEYSQCTEKLKDLPSIFTHKFFYGIREGLNTNSDIHWENVLALCRFVIESINQTKYEKSNEFNILNSIASLIEEGIQADSIDFSLKTNVWDILKLLVPIENSDNTWEENYPTKDWDALGISINTVNGITFHAILKYSIWCNTHLKKNEKVFAPEVKELLSLYFDKKIVNSISRQAVLGHHLATLYYFDKNWIVANLDNLFRKQTEKLSQASWDGYLTGNMYNDTFEDLISEYTNHVKKLDAPLFRDSNLIEFDKHVIDHITLAYLFKTKKAKKIFNYMLEHSHEKVLSHCSWYIGRILHGQKEKSSKLFDKDAMYQIWNNSKLTGNEELHSWVKNSPFDKNQTLKLIYKSLQKSTSKNIRFLSYLVEELIPYAKTHPSSTIKCLELLLKMKNDNPELYLPLHSLKEIFEILLKKSTSKQKTVTLIHYLGELNFNEFRELL